jgi:deoxycytidylate deaminase
VVVSPDNRDQWVGYNGPPAGFQAPPETPDRPGCSRYCRQGERASRIDLGLPVLAQDPEVRCPSIHAEVNALMQSARDLRRGGTVYVTAAPCWKCALAVLNSGVGRLVCPPYEQPRLRLGADVEAMASEVFVDIKWWGR